MTSDDYKPLVQGPLRLKGIGPVGIKKKKKKKKKPIDDTAKEDSKSKTISTTVAKSHSDNGDVNDEKLFSKVESSKLNQFEDDHEDRASTKTPSERAYEEMRKKRLIDRLSKDGLKTHKQRVEELNKYLSNLSEHHDMPRIGPG